MTKITEAAKLKLMAKKKTGEAIQEDEFKKLKKKHKELVSPEAYLFKIELVEALLKTVKSKNAKYLGIHLGAENNGTLRLILAGADKLGETITPACETTQEVEMTVEATAIQADIYFLDKTDPTPPPPWS